MKRGCATLVIFDDMTSQIGFVEHHSEEYMRRGTTSQSLLSINYSLRGSKAMPITESNMTPFQSPDP